MNEDELDPQDLADELSGEVERWQKIVAEQPGYQVSAKDFLDVTSFQADMMQHIANIGAELGALQDDESFLTQEDWELLDKAVAVAESLLARDDSPERAERMETLGRARQRLSDLRLDEPQEQPATGVTQDGSQAEN